MMAKWKRPVDQQSAARTAVRDWEFSVSMVGGVISRARQLRSTKWDVLSTLTQSRGDGAVGLWIDMTGGG